MHHSAVKWVVDERVTLPFALEEQGGDRALAKAEEARDWSELSPSAKAQQVAQEIAQERTKEQVLENFAKLQDQLRAQLARAEQSDSDMQEELSKAKQDLDMVQDTLVQTQQQEQEILAQLQQLKSASQSSHPQHVLPVQAASPVQAIPSMPAMPSQAASPVQAMPSMPAMPAQAASPVQAMPSMPAMPTQAVSPVQAMPSMPAMPAQAVSPVQAMPSMPAMEPPYMPAQAPYVQTQAMAVDSMGRPYRQNAHVFVQFDSRISYLEGMLNFLQSKGLQVGFYNEACAYYPQDIILLAIPAQYAPSQCSLVMGASKRPVWDFLKYHLTQRGFRL